MRKENKNIKSISHPELDSGSRCFVTETTKRWRFQIKFGMTPYFIRHPETLRAARPSGMTNQNKSHADENQHLRCLSYSLRNSVRGRFQIKFGMTPLLNTHGFTLIEMLVVVLIIAVLATIALPQYQKAVRRARLTEAKVILKNLTNAQDMYYLRGGVLANFYSISNWNAVLDEQFPEVSTNWKFRIDDCVQGSTGSGLVGCINEAEPTWEEGYSIDYVSNNYCDGESYCRRFICWVYSVDGAKKCTDFGGTQAEDDDRIYILP